MRILASLVLLWAVVALEPLRAQPKITLPGGTTIELGTVNRGEVLTREVTVANTGTDTLVIEQVRTSCGCTGSMMSTSRIAPGGTGVLRLTLDTRNLSGEVTKTVMITSNSPQDRTTSIQLLGTVHEEITLRPQQFWFKNAEVGKEAKVEIQLRNAGEDTLHLRGYRTSLEGFSLTIPDSAVAPGSEVTLTAAFTPARAMPVIADAIFVLSSNPRQPEIYVPVFGNAKEFRFDQTGP